jgi:flagellar P-ring protein precursor FlgI
MILATLLLAFPQDAGTADREVDDPVPVVVRPALGGIEAPSQPSSTGVTAVVRGFRPEARAAGSTGAISVRIRDLVGVRGQEDNVVIGIGLVSGLAGTGDSSVAARQNILNYLLTQNLNVDLGSITSKNVALVTVESVLPPGIKPGQRIDARVSSIYDAQSLVGGTLLFCELYDSTGQRVYGTVSGAVSTGAFSAEGDGGTAVRNHLTVGIVPRGCKVEREVPSQIVSEHGFIYLDARALRGSFGNCVRIADAINAIYQGAAVPVDAMTVRVQVPDDLPTAAHVAYLDSILQREIVPETFARVVVNERTGVIVMGADVRITHGALTKGNLTVTVSENPEASQPGPFSEGTTEVLPRTSLLIEEEDNPLSIVNGAATLGEVVEVLNVLGVTPRDMIQILEAMSQSGMLHAEIVVL